MVGSGGKTGKLIVESLSKKGIRVKPTSRSGSQLYSSLGIETVSADVIYYNSFFFFLNRKYNV